MTQLDIRPFLIAILLLTAGAPAQDSVSFSFDGAWVARGRTGPALTAPRSYVSLAVGGYPEVVVWIDPGDTAITLTDKSKTELERAGFTVERTSPTSIRVTGRASGSPIIGKGAIGENDDLLVGTDLEVVHASVAFGAAPGPTPTEEGYALARPTGTLPCSGGRIVTTLDFAGATQPTVIVVDVPVGSTAPMVDQLMLQGFLRNGVVPRAWIAPNLMQPSQDLPFFGLTTDVLGHRISHVACEPRIDTEMIQMQLQSCMPIRVGVTEDGWAWPATPGMHLGSNSFPQIGSTLTLDLDTHLPGSIAGFFVGFQGWSMPIPYLLFGTPAPSHDGPTLFVQPIGPAIAGSADGNGQLHVGFAIPQDPGLIGLPLHWQGFDVQAPAPTTIWLSNGLITRIGR